MDQDQLTLPRASKPDGVIVIGTLAVRQLQVNGVACFFVNSEGVVEIAPPVEIAMDYMPEGYALHHLSEQHQYTDQQLTSYLKARDAREAARGKDL